MKAVCDKHGALLILDGKYHSVGVYHVADVTQRSCLEWDDAERFMNGSKKAWYLTSKHSQKV
jgi:hypothetical protein